MINRSERSAFTSAAATITAAALLVTAPGPLATRAYAQMVSGAAASGRSAGVNVVAPQSVAVPSASPLSSPAASLGTPSLSLPSAIPTVSPAARAAAASAIAPQAAPIASEAAHPRDGARSAAPHAAAPTSRPAAAIAAETPAPRPAASSRGLRNLVSRILANRPGAAPQGERAAASLNAVFDANSRKASPEGATAVQGRAGRVINSLKPAAAISAVNECAGGSCGVPTPGAHKEEGVPDSIWNKPLVRYGAPIAILGATALIFQASLIPAAVISGALMFSILAHESAHILGLRIWGDPSPKEAGRDDINPFAHIDVFGTLLLPAVSLAVSQAVLGFPVLFGWAKPVPVDFNNLKDVQHDAAKVAALGPLMNLGLAGLAFGALWALPALGLMSAAGTGALILSTLWKMNLALTLFNLLPLPWLDGGKLLVAMFSKSAYARWTANPNLPEGYQGIFRRIYEGPAYLLSRFNIKSLDQVNTITRVATLAALGAFYALVFTTMQFPLLFLALPCSYDYWCIREKVRSEEAVEEMMDLMSQWGAALVQIAEDHDAESEVSSYEAEHAMKNAVDQLLEDLMAKEEFQALSDEEKIAEFMRVYPDMAVKFLKEKVFTQDSEEKIREILADPRNENYMARLQKWLADHKVFEKMHSPHAKKKLKDSMKEADEKRARGAGGSGMAAFAPLGLLALAAGIPGFELMGAAPEIMISLAAALGLGAMLGTVGDSAASDAAEDAARAKVRSDSSADAGRISVTFADATSREQADTIAAAMGGEVTAHSRGMAPPEFRASVPVADAEDARRKVMVLARRSEVERVDVHPTAYFLTAAEVVEAAAPAARAKLVSANLPAPVGSEGVNFYADFASGQSEAQVREALAAAAPAAAVETKLRMHGMTTYVTAVVNAPDAVTAARFALAAAASETVTKVVVEPTTARVLNIGKAVAAAPAAPTAKWTQNGTMSSELEFWINVGTPQDNPTLADQQAFMARHNIYNGADNLVQSYEWINGYRLKVVANDWAQAERIIREANTDPAVTSISVHPEVVGRLDLSAAVDATEAAAQQPPPAFEKISSEADWDEAGKIEVIVTSLASDEKVAEIAAALGGTIGFSRPYNITVNAADASAAAAKAVEASRQPDVMMIKVHPRASREVRAQFAAPLPSKAQEDPAMTERKTVRLELKEGTKPSAVKEFVDMHVRSRALRYKIEAGAITLVLREMRYGAALASAVQGNEHLATMKLSPAGMQALEEYRGNDPDAFDHSIANDATHSEQAGADEARGVLLQAREGAGLDAVKAWAEGLRLKLVEADYRGMTGLHLFEAAESDDPAWSIDAAASAVTAEAPVSSLRPLAERPAAEAPAAADAPAETPAQLEARRRDAQAAWLNFLQTQVLIDGKSTLNPKAVGLISTFLKPVVPPAGQKRHPVIGRVKETKRVIPILTAPRGMINSVMLVGPAGTGKTAVFEGLAQLIEDSVNQDSGKLEGSDGSAWLDIRRLRGRWFVNLDIDRLLAEDEPIKVLLSLLDLLPQLNDADSRKGNRVILLMDETQKLRMDPQGVKIMNALKGPIRDGVISVAGTTTEKEWKEYFDSDDALKSRFEKIDIDEPTVEETQQMLHGAKSYYEWKHEADISDEALDAAAKLSDQFDKETHNPRKSVKLVEQTAELARPDNLRAALALELREGWRQLGVAVTAAAKELAKKGIASAIALPMEAYNKIAVLVDAIANGYAAQAEVKDGRGQIDVDLIKKVLAEKTGISAGQLTLGEEDASRYVNMEAEVEKKVVNQGRAIRALANAIRRNKSGLSNPHKPMGKFLFVGPTGTGKTHLVKELARFLFKDPEAYVRFDMSEFMEEHTYMRLVGAPPSYVGYGAGGQLTEAVRKRPYTVILFDEVEKAHPKVWDVFLQILDDGRLTDSEGRTVDFKNTVIIMTSNVGMGAVDSQKYERMLQEKWEQIKRLDTAQDPAAVAAAVEKGLASLRKSQELALDELRSRNDKAIAALESKAEDLTDLAQISAVANKLQGLRAEADRALKAAAAEQAKAVESKRGEIQARYGINGDIDARRAQLAKDVEEIEKAWDAEIALAIQEGVMSRFRPEFINRLDEDPDSKQKWVIFNRLKRENIGLIAKLQIKEFIELMRERQDTDIEVDDAVMDLLVEHGFSPLYGARPMQGAIEKFIVDPLAKWVLEMAQQGGTARGRRIKVSVENGTTKFESLDRPEKVVEKRTLEGTAEALTREVMTLVEAQAAARIGDAPAPEPTESTFDALLRQVTGRAAPAAAPAAAPVFNPQTSYPGTAGTTVKGEHNTAAKKDKALRGAGEDLQARAKAAGAVPAVLDVLQPEAGQPGEGWVKHFTRHAKTEAEKAGAAEPVSVSYETTASAVRVRVHSAHAMSEGEAEAMRLHFTGNPPKDLKAAQQAADAVNMTAAILRDHNLLDLYRKLTAIPGARFGYSTGAQGTDYWIELPLSGAAAAPRGSLPVVAAADAERPLTPHQERERAKTKELFLKTLLSTADSGPNMKVAAASGWAALAGKGDLAAARRWIVEKGWADRDATESRLTDTWPLLMAAALLFKRYGTAADAEILVRILKKYTSSTHAHIPAKMALIDAVGSVLARAGRERARAVYDEAAAGDYTQKQVKEAAQLALGKVGVLEDLPTMADAEFKEVNPDSLIELLERVEPARLEGFFEAHWPPQPDGSGKYSNAPFKKWDAKQKILILKLVGRGYGRPERDLAILKEVLNGTLNDDRVTHYHAAEAYSRIAARLNLSGNLQRQLEKYLEKHSFTSYDDKWPVLLAYLYTAQKVGGPELLDALETAMRQNPGNLNANYEQPFFELPVTWAKVVVRNGLFAGMTRSEPNADGTPGLSKIQKMLTSQDPMIAAAALYAIALEQQRLGGRGLEPDVEPRPDAPAPGDLPELYTPGSSSSSGGMHQDWNDFMHNRPGNRGRGPHLPPAI
ncbi:MAG: AAA family ATPase [Elusimicrobia bacterium]|nr:AAA family ATPase [Elusimicrobiota bacterium]